MIYEFAATQDLHGYDKPWAPGAGKNLFPLPTAPMSSDGVSIEATESGEIWVHGTPTIKSGYIAFNFPDISDSIVGETATISINEKTVGVGVSSGATGGTLNLTMSETVTERTGVFESIATSPAVFVRYDVGPIDKKYKIQLEASATKTSFAPYENICPIEGYNIWDPSQEEMIQVYAGYVNANTRELYLRPVYQEYAGEELVGPWMSSLDPYKEDATPTEGAFVIDFGGELESFEITPFMLQTLLESLGIRQHFTDGAGLLNKLMDQAQGRVRSEEELLHLSRPLNVIAIGDQLPAGITFKPISKDVLPGLPGKFIR